MRHVGRVLYSSCVLYCTGRRRRRPATGSTRARARAGGRGLHGEAGAVADAAAAARIREPAFGLESGRRAAQEALLAAQPAPSVRPVARAAQTPVRTPLLFTALLCTLQSTVLYSTLLDCPSTVQFSSEQFSSLCLLLAARATTAVFRIAIPPLAAGTSAVSIFHLLANENIVHNIRVK